MLFWLKLLPGNWWFELMSLRRLLQISAFLLDKNIEKFDMKMWKKWIKIVFRFNSQDGRDWDRAEARGCQTSERKMYSWLQFRCNLCFHWAIRANYWCSLSIDWSTSGKKYEKDFIYLLDKRIFLLISLKSIVLWMKFH